MLVLSENKLNELKNNKYVVYSKCPLDEGIECLCSNDSFNSNDTFYVKNVKANHIKHDNGKFYYTEDDLSTTIDWFPAQLLPINSKFTKSKSRKSKIGSCIKSNKCIVDVSGLPSFNGIETNEDATVNEYRLYITLFNNYTVAQCQFERHNLFDAQFKSSKYDLVSKIQNSDFLKSNDFVVINSKRCTEESVAVALVIKENKNGLKNSEYGDVYINMDNKISIIWH